MTPFKVAFIGAGSIGFTRQLLSDLLTVPEFQSNISISCNEATAQKPFSSASVPFW